MMLAVVFALLSSFTLESAHVSEMGFAEPAHGQSVASTHTDRAPQPELIQGGHCAAHCAGQSIPIPSTSMVVAEAPLVIAAWTPRPEDLHAGIPPTLQDQPPRG